MSPSVTVDEQTAERIEELQRDVERATGRTVSKREVVSRIVMLQIGSESEIEAWVEEHYGDGAPDGEDR